MPKGLEGRQTLDGVEEFRAEALHRLVPDAAPAALDLVPGDRRGERDQGRHQHDRRDRHIPPRDKGEDRNRRQRGDADLRQILAEKALQLLDPVNQRQHDAAGAFAGKPGRAQFSDLVVETPAQIFLHAAGGTVRDNCAAMIEQTPQEDGARDPKGGHCDRGRAGAAEDTGEKGAEQRKPRDPERRRGEADGDRQQDAAPQSAGQLP